MGTKETNRETTKEVTMSATTTVWEPDFTSGISPVGVDQFVATIARHGAAGTGESPSMDNYRNVAGHPSRYGIQAHDDFTWAARRFAVDGSHAAWQQSGRGYFATDALGRVIR
jgi:hypothetical protein